MRAYIEITEKPRLIKTLEGLWMCVGLKKSWWGGSRVVTRYGATPADAFWFWN